MGANMFGVHMILGLPWFNWVDPVIRWHERKLYHVRRTKSGDDGACLHETLPLETERPVEGGVPPPPPEIKIPVVKRT